MALKLLSKTVTTAGVRVALSATPLTVKQAMIQVKDTNTGKIYVGDNTVTSSVSIELGYPSGNSILPATRLASATGATFDLASIYIDSEENGEGVNVFYET